MYQPAANCADRGATSLIKAPIMVDFIQKNHRNECSSFLMSPDWCLCEKEQYGKKKGGWGGSAVKLFIKYCGKNMLAKGKGSAYLSLPNNGVCSQKVKRNVTRCGEPLFRAYEMY